MPADVLAHALVLASNSSYDYLTKVEWLKDGKRVLRQLVRDLALVKGSYSIRAHEGGPAVAGECILHSDTLYICLTWSHHCDDAGYARVVKSRQDYVGERNISIPKNYAGLLCIAQGLLAHGAAFQVVASV